MTSVALAPSGPAMPGVVMAAAYMMAGVAVSGATRMSTAVASRDGGYNCEKPRYRKTYEYPESSHGLVAPRSFAVRFLLVPNVSRPPVVQLVSAHLSAGAATRAQRCLAPWPGGRPSVGATLLID
jgi:hypothetical protein